MKGLVSIIIPTYGGGDCVERAVVSSLNQQYPHVEVIVVDDNGKDTQNQIKTAEVLSDYIADGKIKYICHEVNKNGSAARNTGVKAAIGEFVCLLDDDDIIAPDKIERQVALLSSLTDDYAAVYCSHKTFLNDDLVEELHVAKSGSLLYECLTHEIEVATSSLMIRKTAYDSIQGFDESFRRHQDWEFVARLCAKYEIQADDFFGYTRILTMRNGPKSPEQAVKYRRYYIEKMQPLLETFKPSTRKKIIYSNLLDAALWYLKNKDIKGFVKEYRAISPGFYGISFMIKRIGVILKRGKFVMVKS